MGVEYGELRVARATLLTSVSVLAAVLGVGLLLVGPATWTGYSLASTVSTSLPSAGPTAADAQTAGFFRGGFGGSSPPFQGNIPERFAPLRPVGGFEPGPRRFGGTPPTQGGAGENGSNLQVNSALLSYLESHQGSAKYLFATMSSGTAEPYIISTGKAVMALGGFTGSDRILTVSQLQTVIREGQVHYFVLSGGGFGGIGGSGNSLLTQWIDSHGTVVTVGGTVVYYVSSAAAS